MRIAVWSGPRNLSTALMRSFGARPDCAVVDEPFYAAYLQLTGRGHPMRQEVLDAGPTDWREAEAQLLGPAPGGKAIFYQKHMVQHMVPQIGRDWFAECRHAILIRHPARVLASFSAGYEDARASDLGIGETEEILADIIARTGQTPPVIEAEDIRKAPERILPALCDALGVEYTPAMLSWQPGIHPTDGVWAPHWYSGVAKSTGFSPAPDGLPILPAALAEVAETLIPAFDRLQARKLAA